MIPVNIRNLKLLLERTYVVRVDVLYQKRYIAQTKVVSHVPKESGINSIIYWYHDIYRGTIFYGGHAWAFLNWHKVGLT